MSGMRLMSLLAGGLVLVLPPMLMPMGGGMSFLAVAGGMFGMILVSATFFYVAVAGRQMRRGGQARSLGAALLSLPALASMMTLATHSDESMLWGSGGLLVFTVVLFLHFVIMPTLGQRQRPMRERERHEPTARLLPAD